MTGTAPPLRLLWEGDFNPTSSVGQVNIELARRVANRVDLSIRTRTARDSVPAALRPFVDGPLPAVDVHLRHGADDPVTPPREGAWVWVQAWELGAALPCDWLRSMRRSVDAVLVYSPWVRDQVVRAGVPAERVMVAPLGVDAGRFSPDTPPLTLPTSKCFRFLYVGGTSLRKGNDVLLRAYLAAFTARDDVALVLKEFGNDGRYESVGLLGFEAAFAGPDAPEVMRIPADLPVADLAGLYTACQAFVHPYRGEGFCLPLAEAMASGLHVITTDLGGASCFCTEATARLLSSRSVYLPRRRLRKRSLSNFPHWQEPSIRELIGAMRAIYEQPSSGLEAAARGRALIKRSFTWERAANVLMDHLARVAAVGPRRRSATVRQRPRVTLGVYTDADERDPSCVTAALGRFVDEIVILSAASARNAGRGVDAVTAAKNDALLTARTEYVCLLSAGERPTPDFGLELRECLDSMGLDGLPAISARVLHESSCAAMPPLERYVPVLVRVGRLRFASDDPAVLTDGDGRPACVPEVPQLAIYRTHADPAPGSARIVGDVRQVLMRHRAGDAAAALSALRTAAAKWLNTGDIPRIHESFFRCAYVSLAAASGLFVDASEAAVRAEALCAMHPTFWAAVADAHVAAGRFDPAAAAYHRAIGLERHDGARRGACGRTVLRALLGLAAVAQSQGIEENAYRFHRYALAYAPDDPSLTVRLAALAGATHRSGEAVALLAKALTLGAAGGAPQ